MIRILAAAAVIAAPAHAVNVELCNDLALRPEKLG